MGNMQSFLPQVSGQNGLLEQIVLKTKACSWICKHYVNALLGLLCKKMIINKYNYNNLNICSFARKL
jgi:hypothetical protein